MDEKTIRAYRIDLKQFFDFNGQEEVVMSREVIRQYILPCTIPYSALETLFATGIRISELCNLSQKSIDLEQGIFCIRGNKERYLQIGTVQVLEQLQEYKRQWEIELN